MNELIYEEYGVDIKIDALAALGAVSCIWGQIDAVMNIQIWLLSGLADSSADSKASVATQIVTKGINSHGKLRTIRALVKHKGLTAGPLKDDIEKFLKDVGALRTRRNDLIHAQGWYSDRTSSPMVAYAEQFKLKGADGIYRDPIKFDKQTFESLITELADCCELGWKLVATFEQNE